MNSPPDPGSPISTEDSSDSPPAEVEEVNFQPSAGGVASNYLANLTSHLSATFGGGNTGSASKRRLPASGGFGAASSARDPKSRKRGEGGRVHNQWDGVKEISGGKKDKDELIDNALVEYLRREIGDPFQEP